MRLILGLALRDLARDRVHLICNVAVLAGVLVPLLVLFGVKNGVYEALLRQLLDNPRTLQIDSAGNNAFTRADLAELSGWPETAFATLRTRALFDYVNVRPEGGRELREAVLEPTGAGDPLLPAGLVLGPEDVVVSAGLAEQLRLKPGDGVELITQAEDRPRQLMLRAKVAAVLEPRLLGGRGILADLASLDLIEAFYDGYALPDHGIAAGKPLAARHAEFAGLRATARRLEEVAPLQRRIEQRFGIRTEARTDEIETTLALGRNLDLALGLTAAVAATGLTASLVFGFWGEVARKRRMIATLSLLGLSGRAVSLFPLVQALATALIGLAVSFGLLTVAARIAEHLFGAGLPGRLVMISPAQALTIAAAVIFLVTGAALFAARAAQRLDPAAVLREAS